MYSPKIHSNSKNMNQTWTKIQKLRKILPETEILNPRHSQNTFPAEFEL